MAHSFRSEFPQLYSNIVIFHRHMCKFTTQTRTMVLDGAGLFTYI